MIVRHVMGTPCSAIRSSTSVPGAIATGPGVTMRNISARGVIVSRLRASEKNAKASTRGVGRRIDARRTRVPGSPAARS
jgi:hypothetical protein